MWRVLLRRLALAVPTLLAAATIAFVLAHLAPGSPAAALGGDFGAPGLVEEIARVQGLDRPLLAIYGEWLWRLAQGDLGYSFRAQTRVAELIRDRVPVTLALILPAFLLSALIGVELGAVSASRPGGRIAIAALSAFQALPVYLLAQALVLIFAIGLGLLPLQGLGDPRGPPLHVWSAVLEQGRHLVLPVLALTLNQLAFFALLTRARLAEELGRLYVTTARARGLSAPGARRRHALPNALMPLLALFGSRLGALISGALVIETIFALPGLGRLAVTAAIARDQPTVIGVVLVAACAIVFANLVVDLVQIWMDPRLRTP